MYVYTLLLWLFTSWLVTIPTNRLFTLILDHILKSRPMCLDWDVKKVQTANFKLADKL